MAAHSEIERHMSQKGLVIVSGAAGVTTITAPNTTLDAKALHELIRTAEAEGYEVVFTAGALKVRPKDSVL